METVNPQEQNTDIQQSELYKKYKKALNIQHDMQPGPNPFVVACTKIAEELHASKLKELSEKGEPTEATTPGDILTDQGLIRAALDYNREYPDANTFDFRKGGEYFYNRLSPVIAALRAENEESNKRCSRLQQSEIDRTEYYNAERKKWHRKNSLLNDRINLMHEEIASLRAQLEIEPAQFAEWLGNGNWLAVVCLPVDGEQVWQRGDLVNSRKVTSKLLADFRAWKGGKAHEPESH